MANTQSADQKQPPSVVEALVDAMVASDQAATSPVGEYADVAREYIEGLRAAGYVIVPLEPTPAMRSVRPDAAGQTWDDYCAAIWRAMVEASQ